MDASRMGGAQRGKSAKFELLLITRLRAKFVLRPDAAPMDNRNAETCQSYPCDSHSIRQVQAGNRHCVGVGQTFCLTRC